MGDSLIHSISFDCSGHCIQTLPGHEDRVNCDWSDEVRIASTSDDLLFKTWDFHPHRFVGSCKEQHIPDCYTSAMNDKNN